MKKLLIFLIFTCLIFVGCDSKTTNNTLKLQLNDEGIVEEDKISLYVDYTTSEYSFIHLFSISSNYSWNLYNDISCTESALIPSKTIEVAEGDNIVYALFSNDKDLDDIYLYEVTLHRQQLFRVSVNGKFSSKKYYCLEGQSLRELGIEIPEREHFYFDHLSINNEVIDLDYVPTSDDFIDIIYRADQCKLTYLDFFGNVYKTVDVDYGSNYIFTDEYPIKPCTYNYSYEFSSWDTITTNVNRDLIIKPTYNSVSYTIETTSVGTNSLAVYYQRYAKYIKLRESYGTDTYQIGWSPSNDSSQAFGISSYVRTIEIPTTVTKINKYAFNGNTIYNNPSQSYLTTIYYLGTMEQWNRIIKDECWNINTNLSQIICSDGVITDF